MLKWSGRTGSGSGGTHSSSKSGPLSYSDWSCCGSTNSLAAVYWLLLLPQEAKNSCNAYHSSRWKQYAHNTTAIGFLKHQTLFTKRLYSELRGCQNGEEKIGDHIGDHPWNTNNCLYCLRCRKVQHCVLTSFDVKTTLTSRSLQALH